MRPAASRPPDHFRQPPPFAHLASVSGQRPRIRAVATISGEEFREPDLDLVTAANWGALDAPDPSELRAAQALLRERDRTIQGLSARVESLESTMAALLETLHAREAELAEMQELLLPAPAARSIQRSHSRLRVPEAPQPSVEQASVRTPDVDAETAPDALANWPQPIRASLVLGTVTVPGDQPTPRAEKVLPEPLNCFEFCDHLQLLAGITLEEVLGVFVPTYRTTPLGTRVELELELSNGEILRAPGVVAWIREEGAPDVERPGLGVNFIEPSSAVRAALQLLCRAQQALYIEL